MNATETMIKERISFVVKTTNRENFVSMVERSLDNAKVYKPSNCLLVACSTASEEAARWKFMQGRLDIADRMIAVARNVVSKRLKEGFGLVPDWDAINRITNGK